MKRIMTNCNEGCCQSELRPLIVGMVYSGVHHLFRRRRDPFSSIVGLIEGQIEDQVFEGVEVGWLGGWRR